MKFGTTDIQDLKLGTTPIVEVRRGTELIWPEASGTNAFIMTVKTDNAGTSGTNQFTIPTNGTGYDYTVNTSDGQTLSNNTGDLTITFPVAGTYDVEITGLFPEIYFNNAGDRLKLLDIKQWGNIEWRQFYHSFYGCSNLSVSFTDKPTLPHSCRRMFRGCTSFNADLSGWNTTPVQSMDEMFYNCTNFNSDVSGWDVSNVNDMTGIFRSTAFNADISGWDISKVTNMYYAFNFLPSSYNLDAIYNNWSALAVQSNVSVHFGSATYTSAGQAGRDTLINTYGWTIVDGGQV